MITVKVAPESKRTFETLCNKEALDARVRLGVKNGFKVWGRELKKQAQQAILDPPKTGFIYRRFGRSHQASSPGEAPANLTGTLRKSVQAEARDMELEFGYDSSSDPYNDYLEEGSPGGKIKPRPVLKKTIKSNIKKGQEFFEQEILKAFGSL